MITDNIKTPKTTLYWVKFFVNLCTFFINIKHNPIDIDKNAIKNP